MFLDIDLKERNRIACVDIEGSSASYGQLADCAREASQYLKERAVVFILCRNTVGALVSYISMIHNRMVPLLLPADMDRELFDNLFAAYEPAMICCPAGQMPEYESGKRASFWDYAWYETGKPAYPLYPELSLLLTTSGSTGSPKLVRHSYKNIEANPRNVAAAFGLTGEERPMADLALQYTMGMNVICSHLYAGAKVLLCTASIIEGRYWDYLQAQQATSITGVPFHYEIMKRLRFTRSEWPSLEMLSEGGGRLPDELYEEFASYCVRTGKKFIPTFGQTECTARMALLPPEISYAKKGSIGRAIPQGELFLVDEEGKVIEGGSVEGEMCYRGPNVTMGYALCKEDLIKGDEWHGVTHTGDIAFRDDDGCYYIIGRKKRFLKMFGYRVSLDQCERLVLANFDTECACTGTDKLMLIYVTNPAVVREIPMFLRDKTGIRHTAFKAIYIEAIPRSSSNKVSYKDLPKELN